MSFQDAINDAKNELYQDARLVAPAGSMFRTRRKMTHAERYEIGQEIRRAQLWRQHSVESDASIID